MNSPRDRLSGFWQRFPDGVRVGVVGHDIHKMHGILDGLAHYLGLEALPGSSPGDSMQLAKREEFTLIPAVSLRGVADGEDDNYVPLSDAETLRWALQRARSLAALADRPDCDLFACAEGGVHQVELESADQGDETFTFARTWVALCGVLGEAVGGSGSIQIPVPALGAEPAGSGSFSVPGTRRSGGMVSSLTDGREGPRNAVATATFNALATLLYPWVSPSRSGSTSSHGASSRRRTWQA